MSVLVIRAHRRFAVRRKARLRKPGRRFEEGLLIELSLDGCRVSNLARDQFALDQQVVLRIEGADPLEARVRWLGDGAGKKTAGLRFLRPLQASALDQLLRLCRSAPAVREADSAAA